MAFLSIRRLFFSLKLISLFSSLIFIFTSVVPSSSTKSDILSMSLIDLILNIISLTGFAFYINPCGSGCANHSVFDWTIHSKLWRYQWQLPDKVYPISPQHWEPNLEWARSPEHPAPTLSNSAGLFHFRRYLSAANFHKFFE